jgi:hypothetical protein
MVDLENYMLRLWKKGTSPTVGDSLILATQERGYGKTAY